MGNRTVKLVISDKMARQILEARRLPTQAYDKIFTQLSNQVNASHPGIVIEQKQEEKAWQIINSPKVQLAIQKVVEEFIPSILMSEREKRTQGKIAAEYREIVSRKEREIVNLALNDAGITKWKWSGNNNICTIESIPSQHKYYSPYPRFKYNPMKEAFNSRVYIDAQVNRDQYSKSTENKDDNNFQKV